MEVTFIVSVIPIPALCLVPKSFGMFNFWDSGKKHPAYFISSYVMPLIEKVHGRVIDLSSIASTFYKRKEFPFVCEEKEGFFQNVLSGRTGSHI